MTRPWEKPHGGEFLSLAWNELPACGYDFIVSPIQNGNQTNALAFGFAFGFIFARVQFSLFLIKSGLRSISHAEDGARAAGRADVHRHASRGQLGQSVLYLEQA